MDIWPLLFWNSFAPLLSEKPVLSQHFLPAALAYRGQPSTKLLNNTGDPSAAHSLSLCIRTLYPKNSGLMVFWPYIVYLTSLNLLISSPSICHLSSGISTLLNVGRFFFQASKDQLNTIYNRRSLLRHQILCHRFSLPFPTLYCSL